MIQGVLVCLPFDSLAEEFDDPEPDLRLDPTRAGSHTVTYGEPDITVCEPSCIR